jgi:CheY-like chemotaxis protein
MRILVVDDNEAVRRGVKQLLSSRTDWDICGEARNGLEAIEKTTHLLPDVVLLDISMPGLDGLAVARHLRQTSMQLSTSLVIIMMSQNDPVVLLPRTVEAGANGCVDKSRLAADLIVTIENAQSARPGARTCDTEIDTIDQSLS